LTAFSSGSSTGVRIPLVIKYKRHSPGFVIGFHSPADRGTVETVDELLALDWVRVWETGHQEEDDPNRFEYFCRSSDGVSDLLMVQMKGSYWVVAEVSGDLAEFQRRFPKIALQPASRPDEPTRHHG
jgi:hypothetical protein